MQTPAGNAWEIPQTPPGWAAEVATAELAAELALLGTLNEEDWTRPTDCVGWDVHDLTAHLVGEYEEIFRPGALLRRLRKGHRRYPGLSRLDAHNQQQIDELGGQSGPELIDASRGLRQRRSGLGGGCPGRCAACRWPGCFPNRRGGCPTWGLAICWT